MVRQRVLTLSLAAALLLKGLFYHRKECSMRKAKQNAIQSKAESQAHDLRGVREAVYGTLQLQIL
jgi:hypothetical protein